MNYLLLASILLLSACSAPSDDADKAPEASALVAVGRAEPGRISETMTLYGMIESGPAGKQALSAPADAVVRSIIAPVGARVAAGDVIVRLDPAPSARLDLVRAATDARAAEAALARAVRLRADGLVSDAEVDAARIAATSANATRSSLTQRTAQLVLRAQVAGFVQTVPANIGEMVTAGTVVATLSGNGSVRARFGIDPALVGRLQVGVPLIIARGDGGGPLETTIASIDPAADSSTRLASIFGNIPASAGFSAGQTLRGEVRTDVREGQLTIPYAALLDDGGQPFVYVVQTGVARRRDVATGAAQGDRIAVTRGLKPGDAVVTQGGTAVEDGIKVRTR